MILLHLANGGGGYSECPILIFEILTLLWFCKKTTKSNIKKVNACANQKYVRNAFKYD